MTDAPQNQNIDLLAARTVDAQYPQDLSCDSLYSWDLVASICRAHRRMVLESWRRAHQACLLGGLPMSLADADWLRDKSQAEIEAGVVAYLDQVYTCLPPEAKP